jgi:hypothetical protein
MTGSSRAVGIERCIGPVHVHQGFRMARVQPLGHCRVKQTIARNRLGSTFRYPHNLCPGRNPSWCLKLKLDSPAGNWRLPAKKFRVRPCIWLFEE